tara:strand:+ start:1042 stop:1200 length:159 start_codon:yes stop_codon:yes gene_type:complete
MVITHVDGDPLAGFSVDRATQLLASSADQAQVTIRDGQTIETIWITRRHPVD